MPPAAAERFYVGKEMKEERTLKVLPTTYK